MINISSHKSHYLEDNIFTLELEISELHVYVQKEQIRTRRMYRMTRTHTNRYVENIYMYRNREMTFIYLLFIRVRLG